VPAASVVEHCAPGMKTGDPALVRAGLGRAHGPPAGSAPAATASPRHEGAAHDSG
jgi:hypothetical protein